MEEQKTIKNKFSAFSIISIICACMPFIFPTLFVYLCIIIPSLRSSNIPHVIIKYVPWAAIVFASIALVHIFIKKNLKGIGLSIISLIIGALLLVMINFGPLIFALFLMGRNEVQNKNITTQSSVPEPPLNNNGNGSVR